MNNPELEQLENEYELVSELLAEAWDKYDKLKQEALRLSARRDHLNTKIWYTKKELGIEEEE